MLAGSQGDRPVTLIGYSFGARVIFSCLRELASMVTPIGDMVEDDVFAPKNTDGDDVVKEEQSESSYENSAPSTESKNVKNPLNLIQDVILLGAPVNSKSRIWKAIRQIVGGRIVNGYSTQDMILGIVYRWVILIISKTFLIFSNLFVDTNDFDIQSVE